MPETPERPKDKKCPSESCGRSYHHTMQLTYCPICGAKLVEVAQERSSPTTRAT